MDPIEQMPFIFFAGALVGALLVGFARRGTGGIENEVANLRGENARLAEENNLLRAEHGAGGGEAFL